MQGSNFSREIEDFRQLARPSQRAGQQDPLDSAMGHVKRSLQELRDAYEQLARHYTELDGKIHEGEQRYRSLAEMSSDGLVVCRNGRVLLANPAAAAIVGAAGPTQLAGKALIDLIHPDSRPAVEHNLRASDGGTRIGFHEERFIRPDGTEICVEMAIAPVIYEDAPAAQIVFRDVTDRRHLQAEVIAISNTVRSRIGRDLHDVLGQNLTGIAFLSKLLERKLQQAGLAEAADALAICDLASEGMRQTRTLARGLFPAELQASEFASTMTALAMDTQRTFHMACRYDEPKEPPPIHSDEVATHLYHIAQEAITNAVKHGKARSAHLDLQVRDDHLVLTIRDDGAGFEPTSKPRGIGLRIMGHRANLLGGTLSVESQPGQGTTLTCIVPVASAGRTTEE